MLPTTPGFPILDVTDWRVTSLEPAGSDEKVWLVNSQSQRALFKPNRAHRGDEQGEDWAEKLAAEIAILLGVPAARIDLASRDNVRGCISYNVAPPGRELQPGAALMSDLVGADFDPRDRAASGHTLPNIAAVLASYSVPPGFDGPSEIGGFGVFTGYLMFDALIANRDRHSENWAVLRSTHPGEDILAPTYDHASSLGFNLRDTRRAQLLQDTRMFEAFLQKGDAYRFEDGQRVTLVDYTHRALTLAGGLTRAFWQERLSALNLGQVARLAERITTMSDLARNLAFAIVSANRRRLLDG